MNILFLLSSLEPAGSETYCVSLAKAWAGRHTISWISDRLHFGQPYQPWPISAKIFPTGILNVLKVSDFIRLHRIELVHSHSRRAHWVAKHAARRTGIRHVATVHQPPPVHFFSRLEPCLGDQTIAVSEAARDHVIRYFGVKPERVHLIRNGIEIPAAGKEPPKKNDVPAVLLLGRLSGHRWEAYQFFLDVLKRSAASLPTARYRIAGRVPEERRAFVENQLVEMNRHIAPSTLELVEWTRDLPALIRSVDGVIAAGRSALESLALEKPVIVLGERGVLGLCQAEIWPRCRETNFADHQAQREFYPALLEVALRQVLDPNVDRAAWGRWGRAQVIRDYNLTDIAPQVEAVYQKCISRS